MRFLSIICGIVFVLIYCFAPDFIVVDQNKLDTLYMVSTIFFSAAIGMVVSNNVHLENREFKENIRNMNHDMTLRFICCFFLETIAYFFYDEGYSHFYGLHLHLIVLGLILYSTCVYVFAMPIVTRTIAVIENHDYAERELTEQKKQQIKILDYCREKPRSEKELKQLLYLSSDKELSDILSPLQEDGAVVEMDKKIHLPEDVKKRIFEECMEQSRTLRDLKSILRVAQDDLQVMTQEMVKDCKLVFDGDSKRYVSVSVERIEEMILSICKIKEKNRFEIASSLKMQNTNECYSIFIKPLIESGKLLKVSGKGFGAKYKSN